MLSAYKSKWTTCLDILIRLQNSQFFNVFLCTARSLKPGTKVVDAMSDPRYTSSVKLGYPQAPPEPSLPRTLLSILPDALRPWVELTRHHKLTGVIVIYLPYQLGLLYAATSAPLHAPEISILSPTLVFIVASIILRSAGCTWNDVVDYKLDQQVARCRSRSVARGAISPAAGSIFAVIQILLWLGLFWCLCPRSLLCAIFNIPLVLLYPYAKRYTDYPQVILGVTLAWGLLTGSEVTKADGDVYQKDKFAFVGGLACLFLAYLAWTTIYDTVYAFQDIEDDVQAGVKSIAVRWRDQAKILLSGTAVVQIISLSMAGYFLHGAIGYYSMACLATAVILTWMIRGADLGNHNHCAWWFRKGILMVGACMLAGLPAAYCARVLR